MAAAGAADDVAGAGVSFVPPAGQHDGGDDDDRGEGQQASEAEQAHVARGVGGGGGVGNGIAHEVSFFMSVGVAAALRATATR